VKNSRRIKKVKIVLENYYGKDNNGGYMAEEKEISETIQSQEIGDRFMVYDKDNVNAWIQTNRPKEMEDIQNVTED
jgi:hypothetical protein